MLPDIIALSNHPIAQRVHTSYQLYNLHPPLPDDERTALGEMLLSGVPDWANTPLPPFCPCYFDRVISPMALAHPPCACTLRCERCDGSAYQGSVTDLLTIAMALLASPDRWIKSVYAENGGGIRVAPRNAFAVRFCGMGAVYRCSRLLASRGVFQGAARQLTKAVPAPHICHFSTWQDRPEVTHADILAAFERAREDSLSGSRPHYPL